jgi:predicted CoA-binding protein
MPSVRDKVTAFLAGRVFAVAGASPNRRKYGNMVLRALVEAGREAHPVNPNAEVVEGLKCYPDLASLPVQVHGVSVITPHPITERLVEEAGRLGIKHVWMQPGAESEKAVRRAEELGISVIGGDACILVELGLE